MNKYSKNPKISIIIPIFNASNYLERCLESLVNQSFDGYEILLINDCSEEILDEKICNYYTEKYQIFKYIKLDQNYGSAVARNKGIEISSGEYLSFVDADDYCESNMLKVLYDNAILSGAEIVVASHKIIDEKGSNKYARPFHDSIKKGVYSIKETPELLYQLTGHPWGKLFKYSLFIKYNIKAPNVRYNTDLAIVYKAYLISNKISLIKDEIYNYYRRGNTLSTLISENRYYDHLINYREIINFMQLHNIDKNIQKCFDTFFINLFKNTLNLGIENKIEFCQSFFNKNIEKKIIIWGVGEVFFKYIIPAISQHNIICLIDKYSKRRSICGYPVQKPEEITHFSPDIVFIASIAYIEEIKKELNIIYKKKVSIVSLDMSK